MNMSTTLSSAESTLSLALSAGLKLMIVSRYLVVNAEITR
jgi:hypothetical protein